MRKDKLTESQAEVAAALMQLRHSADDLPCFQPSEIFQRGDNRDNGARRTLGNLIKKGLIERRPQGWYPEYQMTQTLADALIEWKNDPHNYDAFQSFELSCY